MLAHQEGKRPDLGVGIGDDGGGLFRLLGPEAFPVPDQAGEGAVEVAFDVEAPAVVVGRDAGGGLAVAEVLGGGDLPGADGGLDVVRKSVELVEYRLFFLVGRVHPAVPGGHGILAVDGQEDVLGVGLLAADRVDAGGAGDLADEAKTRSRAHGLLLLGIAGEDDLGAGAVRDLQDPEGLYRREHAGLVDEDDGLGIETESAIGDACDQLVDAEVGGVEVGPELERDAPGDGGGEHGVAVLAVEIRDRPECCRLSASGRAFDDRNAPRRGGRQHRGGLFVGGGIAFRLQLFDPGVGDFFGNAEALRGHELLSQLLDPLLVLEVAGGCVGAGMGQKLAGVVFRAWPVQLEERFVFENQVEQRVARIPGHETGGGVEGFFEDVGVLEDSFLLGEMVGERGKLVVDFL